MNWSGFKCLLLAGAFASQFEGPRILAQSAAGQPQPNSPGAAVRQPTLPPFPTVKSPVDIFRGLLKMSAAQQALFLAKYPPETQNGIRVKLKEYANLGEGQRELRLRMTELWYYLPRLMSAPSTDRPGQLALVPETVRSLVQVRLSRWDQLPPGEQTNLLESPIWPVNPASQPIATNLPPPRALEEKISKWQRLSPDERETIKKRFQDYFSLTTEEQGRIRNSLPEPERDQIEKTLRKLSQLDSEKRAQVLHALDKFSGLKPPQQLEFLHNAERWKSLAPAERKAWRDLVSNIGRQPPLPPGLRLPSTPGHASLGGSDEMATNH